jgi:hypothetical protein
MDTRRLKPSRIFLQLLWIPKIGDRVLVSYPQTKRRIARIMDENLYGKEPEYQLDIAGDTWWKTRFLTYVPTRARYEETLNKLKDSGTLAWIERDELKKNKWKAALRCNQTLIILSGTAQRILSDLLDYRAFDSRINDAVNQLVAEQTRGTKGAVRLRSV